MAFCGRMSPKRHQYLIFQALQENYCDFIYHILTTEMNDSSQRAEREQSRRSSESVSSSGATPGLCARAASCWNESHEITPHNKHRERSQVWETRIRETGTSLTILLHLSTRPDYNLASGTPVGPPGAKHHPGKIPGDSPATDLGPAHHWPRPQQAHIRISAPVLSFGPEWTIEQYDELKLIAKTKHAIKNNYASV